MSPIVRLLAIDPQNDFCDLPESLLPRRADGALLHPSLPVPGAHADMRRLAGWVRTHAASLDGIAVTRDRHRRLDIAHPSFWRNVAGTPPPPFTPITAAQVRTGEFAPAPGLDPARALAYLEALESGGRLTHMIWPVHCQEGTWGEAVHPALQESLDAWEDATGRDVRFVDKGRNPWTEHYSALRAEIPDPADPATGTDHALVAWLAEADLLYVAGEAGSHCVRATMEHLLDMWPADPGRVRVLSDATSAVAGFEELHASFLRATVSRGAGLSATTDPLPLP